MKIKVLGTGCASCNALHATVKQAVAELGIEATIIKEEDLMQILNYNVMSLPCLVINEKVVSAGKKLSLAEVKAFLTK